MVSGTDITTLRDVGTSCLLKVMEDSGTHSDVRGTSYSIAVSDDLVSIFEKNLSELLLGLVGNADRTHAEQMKGTRRVRDLKIRRLGLMKKLGSLLSRRSQQKRN